MLRSSAPTENLTDFERHALSLFEFTNEQTLPKRLQFHYLNRFVRPFVRSIVLPRVYVHGAKQMRDLKPDRGLLLAANHRSFFDQWLLMLILYEMDCVWFHRIFFPVRANYFYETKTGVLLNYLLGGGSLYPPIFRDQEKKKFNQYAVSKVVQLLHEPHVLVGVHPEGTRGKGPDPYELLPARPGVGQMIIQGRPEVVPVFVNGIASDFVDNLRLRLNSRARHEDPIVISFGAPMDYSEFLHEKPRVTVYKRCSEKLMEHIAECAEVERDIRARCRDGRIADDDPNWLTQLTYHRGLGLV